MRNSAILLSLLFVIPVYAEDLAVQPIMKARADAFARANAEAVQKLKPIMDRKMAAKDLAGANEISALIATIQGSDAPNAAADAPANPDTTLKKAKTILIRADSEMGSPIGSVMAGSKIVLQYESGMWNFRSDADHPPVSPDKAQYEWACLGIFAVDTLDDRPFLLVSVPGGTAQTPFEYTFTEQHKRVVLRITDPKGLGNNMGAVKYRCKLTGKPASPQ